MINELLQNVTLNDLQGNSRELADAIGLDAFLKLVDRYGGTSSLYVPQADSIVIPIRDELIRREFDGVNYSKLARKWNLTDRYIRDIVREKAKEIRRQPLDGQISLF